MTEQQVRHSWWRYFETIYKHGDPDEVDRAWDTLRAMQELRAEFPDGSYWPPQETVYLPRFLVKRAEDVIGPERLARAIKYRLKDQDGEKRELAKEIHSVKGQYAACLCLGLPLDRVSRHDEAKEEGNLGGNLAAFIPHPGNYQLLVTARMNPDRVMVHVLDDGGEFYQIKGWIPARQAQQQEYLRKATRPGGTHYFLYPWQRLEKLIELPLG